MTMRRIRRALDFGSRPDPALGIFETMLVKEGEVQMHRAHLANLNASAKELYGVTVSPPEDQTERRWTGRMRLTYVPGAGLSGHSGFIRADPVYVGLAAFVIPGGLGSHKWADRRLIGAITEEAGVGVLPLLLDTDGAVLEAASTNVLIEEGERLISPPADGRARSGIGRRRLEYDEEPVDLDRLLGADAIVLTSALRTLRLPGGLPLMP